MEQSHPTTPSKDDYSNPPVVETVIGIEFSPLPNFGFVSIAKTQKVWESEYPETMEQPALAPSRPAAQGPGIEIQFSTNQPLPRLWSIAADQHELIQLQHDRLLLNWRRLDAGPDTYPGFGQLVDKYGGLLARFQEHLQTTWDAAVKLEPLVAEWTYVNLIEANQLTSDKAFTLWTDPKLEIGETPLQTRFQHISEFLARGGAQGQVEISAQPVAPGPDAAIQMTVSCKIFVPAETSVRTAIEYCHEAHEVARRAFDVAVTKEAKEKWGAKA